MEFFLSSKTPSWELVELCRCSTPLNDPLCVSTCNGWCCVRSDIKADVWIIVRSETRSSEQRPDVFKNVSEQARTGRTGRFVAALWSHFGQLTTINNYEKRKKQREKSASTRVRELRK